MEIDRIKKIYQNKKIDSHIIEKIYNDIIKSIEFCVSNEESEFICTKSDFYNKISEFSFRRCKRIKNIIINKLKSEGFSVITCDDDEIYEFIVYGWAEEYEEEF